MRRFTHTKVAEVTVLDASREVAAGEAVLVDVREPEEWAAGHAPGAIHQPLDSLHLAVLPTGVPVIAVCRSGGRSAKAAEALMARGISVRNLTGGMQAWSASGEPVVTDDGALGTVL